MSQPVSPFTPEQLEQLNQPLDLKRVKHRPGGGGMQLSYLEGHDVINVANQILGFGNWGFDLLGVEFNPVTDDKGIVVGGYYAARLKLTIVGCIPITEEGVCAFTPGRNPRATIDGHDMSRKGSITDALKRAFRCYGDQFGLSLYNSGLVNGQPRAAAPNGNRPASDATPNNLRPTYNNTTSNTAHTPALPAQPNTNAVRPTIAPSTPQTFNNQNNQNQKIAVPAPGAGATATDAGAGADGNAPGQSRVVATFQQVAGIKRIATKKGFDEKNLETWITQTYGVSLAELSQSQASELITAWQK